MTQWITLFCALGSGLVAGVFYAFSTFVMKALGAIEPPAGIAAMQSINIAVKNVWFLSFLFGLVLPCAWLLYETWGTPALLQRAAALIYIVGTLGVTFACNVPRNDALAVLDPVSLEAARMWADYVPSWTFWNHVRCATSLLAALLFTLAFARSYPPVL